MNASNPGHLTPPRRPVFHILLALADDNLHGLGIADAVAEASEGAVRLGPGTLYRSLDEMRRSGLIEKVGEQTNGDDPRRKYYRITSDGRHVLQREVGRMQRLLEHAKARRIVPEGA